MLLLGQLLHERYGIGCNALSAARETEFFGGGGLHRNSPDSYAHNLRQAGPHRVDVGAQFGPLECDGNIHITNPIALRFEEPNGALEKDAGVDAFVGRVVVGEVLADVARSDGSEECVT